MKKVYLVLLGILIPILAIMYLNTRLYLVEGGNPHSVSPTEARTKGVLIREVFPSIKEIPFNDNLSVLIDKAWFEKTLIQKDRFFWVEKGFSTQSYVVKISYLIKDRNSGNVYKDPSISVLINKGDGRRSYTETWENIIGTYVKGNPNDELNLILEVVGKKSALVVFK